MGQTEIPRYVRLLDGYKSIKDGYTENPFAHYENASSSQIEDEYFMQWVFPHKLHRMALRTATGYRLTYKQAEDVWNNRLGIKIKDDKKKAEEVNKKLIPYLRSRNWFKEMEKLTAYSIEQGEAILMKYYKDQGNIDKYAYAVKDTEEIIGVEAFNVLDYHIPEFDKKGEPAKYEILVKTGDYYNSFITVEVHPSRVIRHCQANIDNRWEGYSEIAAVYDAINILSVILKASGEVSFRWSTGHPVVFTKDLFTESDLEKLKDAIGDFTRRSWHMVPLEFVEKIDLLGQAGSMLNLKALADISIDQICIGSAIPRNILLGETTGVVGGEVSERGYFAILDRRHTELTPFVHKYFEQDVNIQKLLKGVEYFEIDWGVREVLNKMDQAELRQKEISNALALMQLCTINECREVAGFDPVGEDEGGDIIIPILQLELQMIQMQMQQELAQEQLKAQRENVESTSYKQSLGSTEKKAQARKDLNKKEHGKMKDALDEILTVKSINQLSKELEMHQTTIRKMYDKIKKLGY